MAPRGYSSPALVEDALGRTLTAGQAVWADMLIDAAEAWVDERSGRAWLLGTVTDEAHDASNGPYLFLHRAPVVAITAVTSEAGTLGADTDYALQSGATGALYVPYLAYGWLLVTYTTAATVPARVQTATTLLAAHWLLPLLEPDRQGVESYSVGSELSVKLRPSPIGDDIPPAVRSLLPARRVVLA